MHIIPPGPNKWKPQRRPDERAVVPWRFSIDNAVQARPSNSATVYLSTNSTSLIASLF